MSQYVLNIPHDGGGSLLHALANTAPKSKFAHTLLIPVGCALISVAAFLLHIVFTAVPVKRYIAKLRGRPESDEEPQLAPPLVRQHTGFFPDLRSHIEGHGGIAIFTWKMLRLLACIALTALTIVAVVVTNEGHKTIGTQDVDTFKKHGKKHKKHRKHHDRWFSTAEWLEIFLCIFYVSIFLRCRD